MTTTIKLTAIIALALNSIGFAADLYVSPTGTAAGDGSKEKPLDIATALSAKSPAKGGDTIYLLGGTYEGPMTTGPRGGSTRAPFVLAVSGDEGKPIKVMPAPGASVHLNGTVQITSSHAHFVGLEIGDLRWDPIEGRHSTGPVVTVTGGTNAALLNCNLFGGSAGVNIPEAARNFELAGCLIHDFGQMQRQSLMLDIGETSMGAGGSGDGLVTFNKDGTKTIAQNVIFRGCGTNVQMTLAPIQNFDFIQNIALLPKTYAQEPINVDNFALCGNYQKGPEVILDRIRFIGNIAYQPISENPAKPNIRMTSYRDTLNGSAEVKDNYIVGAYLGLSLGRWQDMQVSGNTIWSTGVFLEVSQCSAGTDIRSNVKPDLKGYKIDNNTYYDNAAKDSFRYGVGDEDNVSLADWQALGLDKNSKVIATKSGRPEGTKVIIHPNRHEKGRAHVAVFNWDNQDTVQIDLGEVLTAGQTYRIYNVQDISQTIAMTKPAAEGKYDGNAVSVPAKKADISPNFEAYLVIGAK